MGNTQHTENNKRELEKSEMEKVTGGTFKDSIDGTPKESIVLKRLSSGPFCPHCMTKVDMTPCGGGVYKCSNTRCSYYGKEQQSGDLIWD